MFMETDKKFTTWKRKHRLSYTRGLTNEIQQGKGTLSNVGHALNPLPGAKPRLDDALEIPLLIQIYKLLPLKNTIVKAQKAMKTYNFGETPHGPIATSQHENNKLGNDNAIHKEIVDRQNTANSIATTASVDQSVPKNEESRSENSVSSQDFSNITPDQLTIHPASLKSNSG